MQRTVIYNLSFRILALEAKDIYRATMLESADGAGYNIRDKNGDINVKKFTNTLDYSLESIKLVEAYEKEYRRKDFAFNNGRHLYTQQIICVSFKYSYRLYNKFTSNTFVKAGYTLKDCPIFDGIYKTKNELIAIQTGVKVEHPVSQEILGKYFTYDEKEGTYKQVGTIPTVTDRSELRSYLYKNGFMCDGIKYVRYKRSSGSSRVGKCLFINEKLAARMDKWTKCGLYIKEGDEIDLSAWESYISLPLSSIIDTVEIHPENILVIDDYESQFEDDIIAVGIKDGKLHSEEKKATIKNSIWDGESLMDSSLFGKYSDRGMLLLRNRFFKTCAFNTNLKQWFLDNGIDRIEQLNGFTLATDISQIKLVTTPSSIKYAKFGPIKQWMKNIEPWFGIVKYEKETHYMNGRYAQCHYQLLNSMHLSYEDIEQLLKPSLDYITNIRKDPDILRHYIKYPYDDEPIDEYPNPLKSKNEIVFKLLGINNDFSRTKLYYDFRNDIIRGFLRNLYQGHILIRGNYSTLFGNGFEMLKACIGKFDGTSSIVGNEIYCSKFQFNSTVLGSRSPHINSGNIFLARNKLIPEYAKYFNLTNEICCINSIGFNIQQKLNGCDFDSDTVLLTDNEILIRAAELHYSDFKVPTCFVEAKKTPRRYTSEQKTDLDIKTSINKIGEIVNLSQYLNSIMWHKINNGDSIDKVMPLYHDICKLAVLSGIEIDRAKKEFIINSWYEISALKKKYMISDKGKYAKPFFFKMITVENGYKPNQNIIYKKFDTAMDYLHRIIGSFTFRYGRGQKKEFIPLIDIIREPDYIQIQGYYYNKREEIISIVRSAKEEIKKLYVEYDNKTREEKEIVWRQVAECRQECIDAIDKLSDSEYTMYLTLKEIDKEETKDVARFMFEVLFGKPNKSFFTMIEKSKETIYELVEHEQGDIQIYDIKFEKEPA